ncbi:MAG: MmgE/PrpD family protein [Pseudomonadota bacterium]
MRTIHEVLWEQFGQLTIEDIPSDVIQIAEQCILDCIACAVAGSQEPLSEILRDELAGQTGDASIIGSDLRAPATIAALINGAASHALDFDDTSIAMGGHASVPVLPAVLATAEAYGATGAEVLAAFVVGVEVESRLGSIIGGKHYNAGWHVTSSIGVLGAAAAVSRLLKLNTEQFGRALGLAASQSSGLKANFGTMTKPFHAGHAAERGLLSARLALRGFTANPESFAGKQGLVEAAAQGGEHLDRFEGLTGQWLTRQMLFKYHAACYLTHSAIENVLNLKKLVIPAQTKALNVTVHPSLLDVCGIPRPSTGLEAKFSITATTAMTMLDFDTTDTATFDDSLFQNDNLQSLIEKVNVETDGKLRSTQSKIVIESESGEAHDAFYDTGIPATDIEAQGSKLRAKFGGLVRPILGDSADQLADNIYQLKNADGVENLFAKAS